jgi:hypothetical protein
MWQRGDDDGSWGEEEGLEGGVEGLWIDAVGSRARWGWAVEDDDVQRANGLDGFGVEAEGTVDGAQVGADADAPGVLAGFLLGQFCSASREDDPAALGGQGFPGCGAET